MVARGQMPLDFQHRPSMAGGDFLIGACNRDAVAWLDRWPDWPAPALAVYGPLGAGKTHLAHVFLERTGGVLVTPDLLSREDPVQIASRAVSLVVDDADNSLGEHALFHLYNAAAEVSTRLLITSARAPKTWAFRLTDLASRLRAAPAVELGLPDDDMFRAVMTKLFSDRQIRIDPAVVSYLVPRMERSFAAAARLIEAIDQEAMRQRRDITLPLARQVLETMQPLVAAGQESSQE